ncbi:MAG TPA: hypothetical protein VE083_02500 [Terriglobales bacterium]|nr:hypothetical protein [Terriglobales bacterium]
MSRFLSMEQRDPGKVPFVYNPRWESQWGRTLSSNPEIRLPVQERIT